MKDYLPDVDELNPKRVSRAWLATIINTIDPTYFKELIIAAENRNFKSTTEQDKIEIDSEMLALLKSFVSVGGNKIKRSSLKNLKINSKKRKRPTSIRREDSFAREIRPKFDDL